MARGARLVHATNVPVGFTLVDRLLTIRCEGSYSVDEMRGPWLAIAERSDLPLPLACVLDMRTSDSVLNRSIAELRSIADSFMLRAHLTDKRIAVVTTGGARYGLMRMASTWVELAGIEVRVFRELEPAQQWVVSQLAPPRPV